MARPQAEPKTELAKRLCQAREARGFAERKPFADLLGIAVGSLANYERGTSEPPASILALYKTACNISLDWLITGDGDMFITGKTPYRRLSPREIEYLTIAMEEVEERLIDMELPINDKIQLIKIVFEDISRGKDTDAVGKVIELFTRRA